MIFRISYKETKSEVIVVMRTQGFFVEPAGRDKYVVNGGFLILLKYSHIYYSRNTTLFRLTERLFFEDRIDFVLFIIENSRTVLVTPLASMQDIANFINLTGRDRTYMIQIDPINFFEYKTPWNLNQYLNYYDQLR